MTSLNPLSRLKGIETISKDALTGCQPISFRKGLSLNPLSRLKGIETRSCPIHLSSLPQRRLNPLSRLKGIETEGMRKKILRSSVFESTFPFEGN